jgi:hypothetical protein
VSEAKFAHTKFFMMCANERDEIRAAIHRSGGRTSSCMGENELNELAELLRELEQTLLTLKETEDPERRRLLLRKISRLFAQIDRNHIEKK